MMTFEVIIALALANFALSIKPGPGSTLIVIRGMSGGFKSGYACAQGCNLIEISYFLVVILSLSAASEYIEFVTYFAKSLGAAYLIYLGITGIQKTSLDADLEKQRKAHSPWQSFLAGVAITIGNPLVIVVYSGIIPTVLDVRTLTHHDIAIGVAVVFVVNSISLGLQAYGASFLSKFLNSPTKFRMVNFIASLFMVLLGVIIGWSLFPNFNIQDMYF